MTVPEYIVEHPLVLITLGLRGAGVRFDYGNAGDTYTGVGGVEAKR